MTIYAEMFATELRGKLWLRLLAPTNSKMCPQLSLEPRPRDALLTIVLRLQILVRTWTPAFLLSSTQERAMLRMDWYSDQMIFRHVCLQFCRD
jgi:hypothetical protein